MISHTISHARALDGIRATCPTERSAPRSGFWLVTLLTPTMQNEPLHTNVRCPLEHQDITGAIRDAAKQLPSLKTLGFCCVARADQYIFEVALEQSRNHGLRRGAPLHGFHARHRLHATFGAGFQQSFSRRAWGDFSSFLRVRHRGSFPSPTRTDVHPERSHPPRTPAFGLGNQPDPRVDAPRAIALEHPAVFRRRTQPDRARAKPETTNVRCWEVLSPVSRRCYLRGRSRCRRSCRRPGTPQRVHRMARCAVTRR